jgi:RHS repeat-associated protein
VINDGAAVYTPGISERRSGVSKWSHQDYLGSTKALTNSSETVTDTRQYDAFGLQTGSTGSNPTPFGFAGGWGYQSDETGLQLLGHRYYDPSTGRFLTRDPAKDGRNWYGYCDNNPIRFIDPRGLDKVVIIVAGRDDELDPAWQGQVDNELGRAFEREFAKDGHEVTVYYDPTMDEAARAIKDADIVVLIGQGSGRPNKHQGGVRIFGHAGNNNNRISSDFIRLIRHGRKLKKLILFSCGQGNPDYIDKWLACAEEVYATPGTIGIGEMILDGASLDRFKKGSPKKYPRRVPNV